MTRTTDTDPPGLREVAAAAGVSVTTVSNVLNSTGRYSERTRERVEEAISSLGFVRNRSAFELRTKARTIIGLLVPDLSNSFFARLARGVIQSAAEKNRLVVVSDSANDSQRQVENLDSLSELQVNDLIVLPVDGADDLLERWRPHPLTAAVLVANSVPDDFCSVAVDDEQGGYLAARHLIDRGRRRLAFVAPRTRSSVLSARFRGASQAAAHFDASVDWCEIARPDVQSGVAAARLLVDEGMAFDGVLGVNDLVAIGMLRAFREHSVAVPDQVAVVGYDDLERAQDLPIPLTSVRQPTLEIGSLALRMLLDERTETMHEHSHHRLAPELVARASTVAA